MAHRFISEIRPGDRLEDEVYLIKSKDLRSTTNGGLYIHAVLADKTGQLVARQWQATEAGFAAMPEGGFMHFKGRAENYKGAMQFIIDAVRPAAAGSYALVDYLPTTTKDVEGMWRRLLEILRTIKHPDLVALIAEFVKDEKLMAGFKKAPAAANLHHAYIGGLLEHTLQLLEVAVRVLPLYPRLSSDLVLAGLFLHDVGKSEELTYETTIGYSNHGQLLGHITLATLWVEQKAQAAAEKLGRPLDPQVKWAIQHIILSHHGQYEFGSPKLPAIPEAAAIHHLDNLDAKVTMFLAEIDNDRDPVSAWTNFNKALDTRVYKVDVMGVRGNGAPG